MNEAKFTTQTFVNSAGEVLFKYFVDGREISKQLYDLMFGEYCNVPKHLNIVVNNKKDEEGVHELDNFIKYLSGSEPEEGIIALQELLDEVFRQGYSEALTKIGTFCLRESGKMEGILMGDQDDE